MAIYMCGKNCNHDSYKGCEDSQKSYEGCVIRTGELNGYDDSDFYALVWDHENGQTKQVTYGTTRFWTYHNYAEVDLRDEYRSVYLAYVERKQREYEESLAEAERTRVDVGKEVRSLTTRGKNKGVVGLVRSVFNGDYGKTVAIEVAGEDKYRYIAFNRVEVIQPVT